MTAAQNPQKDKRERDRDGWATLIVPRGGERLSGYNKASRDLIVPVAPPPPPLGTIRVAQP